MASIAISSGHGSRISGAVGFLNEVAENRKVTDRVADLLRLSNVRVSAFHDNSSTSVSANISAIVGWHNRQTRDRDVSVHFNAHQRTDRPMGTECLHRSQASLAGQVSAAMARSGGFINRGAKARTNLGFLNRVNKPALLLEVCFVDSTADAALYRQNFEAICRGIAESISGVTLGGGGTAPPPPPSARPTLRRGSSGAAVRELQSMLAGLQGGLAIDGQFGPATESAVRRFQTARGLVSDGIVGPRTWAALDAA